MSRHLVNALDTVVQHTPGPSLKELAEAAMQMPWDKSESDVPYADRKAIKDAITPAAYLDLLAQRDALFKALKAQMDIQKEEDVEAACQLANDAFAMVAGSKT